MATRCAYSFETTLPLIRTRDQITMYWKYKIQKKYKRSKIRLKLLAQPQTHSVHHNHIGNLHRVKSTKQKSTNKYKNTKDKMPV